MSNPYRTPLASTRLSLAVAAARSAALASRLLGRGGTSLPGLTALRVEPNLVGRLASQLGHGSLIVAGTNGKTTTSALLAAALRAGGQRVVHNRAGSNMLRGVATALALRSDALGRIRGGARLTGLFEVDEAALPAVCAAVQPRVLLLTNLFRDQLDRYGELQGIADRWRIAIAALPSSCTLVLNADDPLVASLASAAPGAVLHFGVADWPGIDLADSSRPAQSADSLYCPRCGEMLTFARIAYAHLGEYRCGRCGFGRPPLDIAASVSRTSADGSAFSARGTDEHGAWGVDLRLALPGRYNVYNALAALAGARAAGVAAPTAARAIQSAKGAFGRAESISVDGKTVRLFLIKNPTGADEVLRVLATGDRSAGLLTLLSDNAADGHDVSWIWDAQFDLLHGWSGPLYCGGTRAEDMALRCKYAGLPAPRFVVAGDLGRAVRDAVHDTPAGSTLAIVATYTAMLAARDTLARAGHVAQYWRRSG